MKSEKKRMSAFGFALEKKFLEEIKKSMSHLEMARSEMYRTLVTIGLDEYAISDSKLRKRRFPIKDKFFPFTVMLPDALNKEIEKVSKKRKQIKRLGIRYLVLLGFEKWKRDNPHPVKVEPDPKFKITTLSPPETYDGPGIITNGNILSSPDPESLSELASKQPPGECLIPSGSNDMNIGEKFQAVIDLIRELDLKITIEKK